jgi:hypothetical protein
MDLKAGDYITFGDMSDLVLLKIISYNKSSELANLLLLVYDQPNYKDFINKEYYLHLYNVNKVIFE